MFSARDSVNNSNFFENKNSSQQIRNTQLSKFKLIEISTALVDELCHEITANSRSHPCRSRSRLIVPVTKRSGKAHTLCLGILGYCISIHSHHNRLGPYFLETWSTIFLLIGSNEPD